MAAKVIVGLSKQLGSVCQWANTSGARRPYDVTCHHMVLSHVLLHLLVLAAQASNGLAWSSAAWAIVIESQTLPVRPAAVALCIASSTLMVTIFEGKLLCVMGLNYYILMLGLCVLASVSGE